jgi:peptide deformylase
MSPKDLTLVIAPSDVLKQVAIPVEITDQTKLIADRMIQIMLENNGIGLAAPQVGLSVQMFVMYIPNEMPLPQVYINPKILHTSGSEVEEEGCLSIPGVKKNVRRFKNISIEAKGLDGKTFKKNLSRLSARCFQHEFDHLQGRLITNA